MTLNVDELPSSTGGGALVKYSTEGMRKRSSSKSIGRTPSVPVSPSKDNQISLLGNKNII
jgi:hypothetical protein